MRISLYDNWAGPRVTDIENNLLGFAIKKDLDAIKRDLDNGVDINMKDRYDGSSCLHIASNHNWLEGVEYLISQGANINLQKSNGYTALMEATQEGNLEVVKYLISKSANTSIKNSNGKTALMVALSEWHLEVVSFLIANNAMCGDDMTMQLASYLESNGINIKDEKQIMSDKGTLLIAKFAMSFSSSYIAINTGLIMACIKGYFEVAKFLIENGAEVNIQDMFHEPALLFAVENNHLNIVKLLVENGALVKKEDVWSSREPNHTILTCASRQGNLEIVKYLIEHGADMNETSGWGSTALMESSSLEISKYLISQGADVNAINSDKSMWQNGYYSVLMYATKYHAFDIAEYYLSMGFDIDKRDSYGWTRLMSACSSSRLEDMEEIKFLVEHGADVNAKSNNNFRKVATMCALYGSYCYCKFDSPNIMIAKYLISKGADVNAVDSSGETLLMYALSRVEYFEIAKMLIERGADVNARYNGITPLMKCLNLPLGQYDFKRELVLQKDIIQMLIERGADVNAIDNQGNNVLSMTDSYKYLLIEAGAKE